MAIAITKSKLWKLIEAFAEARAKAYHARHEDSVSNADAADALCVQAGDDLANAIDKKVTLRVYSYALGDRVGVRRTEASRNSRVGQFVGFGSAIVTASMVATDGTVKYGLNGCAWFPHKDLILLQRATLSTLRQVPELGKDDEDDEEEEEDEDDAEEGDEDEEGDELSMNDGG